MSERNSSISLQPKRRTTQRFLRVIIALALAYFFFTYSSRYNEQFNIKNYLIRVPTTSHISDINLKHFKGSEDEINDLRSQLTLMFPYEPKNPIPNRVWQTWKFGLNNKEFPKESKELVERWQAFNYGHSYIPDDKLMPFLENLYGNTPLILKAFKMMPLNILKADFLRYLLLFARGGIYSDIDTIPLKPLTEWPSLNKTFVKNMRESNVPLRYRNYNPSASGELDASDLPGFIIGIEADPDRPDWSDWYARRIQFCQWTIQSKPGHPILRELILNITATTLNSAASSDFPKELFDSNYLLDYNVNYRHKRFNDKKYDHSMLKDSKNTDGTDIMNWTGPGIFSDLIIEYLNNLIQKNNNIQIFNSNMVIGNQQTTESDIEKTTQKFYKVITEDLQSNNKFPWEFFSLMNDPVLVDDVMVLPITSFSPDVGQMGAKSSEDKLALVKHLFSGSWKEDADDNAEKVAQDRKHSH